MKNICKYSPTTIFCPLAISIFVAFLTSAAMAHVTVEPAEGIYGGYEKLVFRIPHGCDGSSTTKVVVRIPEGVTGVKPQVHPGWIINLTNSQLPKPIKDGHGGVIESVISEVTWTGGPLPDQFMDEFGMSVKLPEGGTKELPFSILQVCEKGETLWDGKAKPAPTLRLRKK